MLRLLGIVLVIAIFVFSGINKILNFNSNVDSLSKKFNYIKNVAIIRNCINNSYFCIFWCK